MKKYITTEMGYRDLLIEKKGVLKTGEDGKHHFFSEIDGAMLEWHSPTSSVLGATKEPVNC